LNGEDNAMQEEERRRQLEEGDELDGEPADTPPGEDADEDVEAAAETEREVNDIYLFITIEDGDHWLDVICGEEPLVRKQLTSQEYAACKDVGIEEV